MKKIERIQISVEKKWFFPKRKIIQKSSEWNSLETYHEMLRKIVGCQKSMNWKKLTMKLPLFFTAFGLKVGFCWIIGPLCPKWDPFHQFPGLPNNSNCIHSGNGELRSLHKQSVDIHIYIYIYTCCQLPEISAGIPNQRWTSIQSTKTSNIIINIGSLAHTFMFFLSAPILLAFCWHQFGLGFWSSTLQNGLPLDLFENSRASHNAQQLWKRAAANSAYAFKGA